MILKQGDCLELMKEIEDKSVDMICCDLPYGTTSCKWDTVIPFDKLWEQYERVIVKNGAIVLFGSQPFTSALISSNFPLFKYNWVWEKNRATGHVHAKNKPMKIHEDILIFSQGNTLHKGQSPNRMPYFPQGLIKNKDGTKRRTRNDAGDNAVMGKRASHKETLAVYTGYPTSILRFSIEMNKKRFHPTQKPVDLLEYLIKTYTNENDLILDNCMGSGSTGIACVNTNRHFIGHELDEKYFKISELRIHEAICLKNGIPMIKPANDATSLNESA